MPMAAEHQRVAAVLRPRTVKPSRKIMPAPRKPTPDTTCAATWVGLDSSGTSASNTTKLAAPSATNVLVRSPAKRWRHWRSNPITDPKNTAAARLIAACSTGTVISDSPPHGEDDTLGVRAPNDPASRLHGAAGPPAAQPPNTFRQIYRKRLCLLYALWGGFPPPPT